VPRRTAGDIVGPRHVRERLHLLYISYDGAAEPLGRSQVVEYLRRLATDCAITLISFEKATDSRDAVRKVLEAAGIEWIPLRYHRRPPVLSTLWDIFRGAVVAARASQMASTQIVHARSYVAGVMAMLAGRRRTWTFLFDIRGFWVDERVEGGLWRRGGGLYRVAKRCERSLFASADGVVTLTEASVPQIKRWLRDRQIPIKVIPTCADVDRYASTPRAAQPRVVWCGSIGTIYRFEQSLALADALGLPLAVFTRQTALARRALRGRTADVRFVPYDNIPEELAEGDIGLCLIGSGFANLARAPTRIAEYLAAGMVVAVSPDIGDTDALVRDHDVGAIVDLADPTSLRHAVGRLRDLLSDPSAPMRCRSLAKCRFAADRGAYEYLQLYHRLLGADVDSHTPHSHASHVVSD
jgi:glycosyltransferase involved in cell wall biosynthesis